MTFHSGSGMKPRRATGRRRSMMMWWSWLFSPMNLFLLKLTVLLKLAANPSENFTSLNHLRMVILSSLLTQYFALGFFHTPLEFLFRCSFGQSQYKATSRRALLLSLVFSGISRHVFSKASDTFFSLCITSMLWRSSNFRKYSSCHKPLIAIQLCSFPNPSNLLLPVSSWTRLWSSSYTSSPDKGFGGGSKTVFFLRKHFTLLRNAWSVGRNLLWQSNQHGFLPFFNENVFMSDPHIGQASFP